MIHSTIGSQSVLITLQQTVFNLSADITWALVYILQNFGNFGTLLSFRELRYLCKYTMWFLVHYSTFLAKDCYPHLHLLHPLFYSSFILQLAHSFSKQLLNPWTESQLAWADSALGCFHHYFSLSFLFCCSLATLPLLVIDHVYSTELWQKTGAIIK